MASNKVSITRCGSYAEGSVQKALRENIDALGGVESFVKKGEEILIKPNLLSGKPPEAAVTTHPSVVKAMILLIKDAGARPYVGDSPGLGTARKAAEKCGILEVCRQTQTELIEFKELVFAENPEGHTFKRLEVAKEVLSFDGIINLPKLKTHAQMYLTLGVKNMFGCVPGKLKPQWHLSAGVDSMDFASMLLDLYMFLKPRLTVIDGIVSMEGNGPGSGTPRHTNLIFSGADCISLDTVIAEALGAKPESIPILKAARLRGMKGALLKNIEVVGEKIEEIRVKDFVFPPLLSVNFASSLPCFIDKRIRKALTSRPHVREEDCNLCSICVEVCPADVMEKTGRIIIDYDRCIRCYCCQEMCPKGAIAPKEGWLKKIIPGM
ncbi:MAG: DUF362 domain-containing protein [Deltaproteobacteria bacterium]|nr:DUF362 domain-containing protein [Deltaproteobacteria bacterium]